LSKGFADFCPDEPHRDIGALKPAEPVKRRIGMAAAWEVERSGAPGDFQDLS